jgi:hypothetical protein
LVAFPLAFPVRFPVRFLVTFPVGSRVFHSGIQELLPELLLSSNRAAYCLLVGFHSFSFLAISVILFCESQNTSSDSVLITSTLTSKFEPLYIGLAHRFYNLVGWPIPLFTTWAGPYLSMM